jgi:tRNA dimethylallyltransferase
MLRDGLLQEVDGLRRRGFGDDAPGMTGTGYREAAACLDGRATPEETVREIVRGTRRYARRQLTWFRNQLPPDTMRVDATEPLETQVDRVLDAWTNAGGHSRGRARSADERGKGTEATTMEERR